jgi:sigma-70-like protein/SnoaL-like protein
VPGSVPDTAATGYRPLLFSIAYGMTGSVGDAEDIVQDAYLGLTRARQAGTTIADPKAYLTTAVGTIRIDGDTASGRAYIHELIRLRDGRSELNYAIYHDRYQRTCDGWKFAERVYEIRYLDATPLPGSAPRAASP